jgi:hypothetical protein
MDRRRPPNASASPSSARQTRPGVCERLGEVKRRWDPEGLLRASHTVALGPA